MGVALAADDVPRLQRALTAAGYTVDGVREHVGTIAHDGLARNETTPALRRTGDRSPLSTLTRLWPLQAPVATQDAERALPGLVDALCTAAILERRAGEVRALVDIRPYSDDQHDWWVVADLTPGLDGSERLMRPDHVLGVSSASTSLAQLVRREPVARALDLGTGSGVQALHLSTHCDQVVATDVNPRCLDLASLTTALNGVQAELRLGSLFEPVDHESFDLIVSNPPFVISPATGEPLAYRDSGLPGDEIVRAIVQEGAAALTDGGWLQVLANWVQVGSEQWIDRLDRWLATTGCDAWVVQREQVDPSRYVEMWLDDAGLRGSIDYAQRYDAWLSWFESQGVESVGFGWLTLRNAGRAAPATRLESWPYDVEQPLGPTFGAWARSVDLLDPLDDEALLATKLVRAPDVVEERTSIPGAEHPAAIVLRSQHGMRRARQVDTEVAGLVGACDGELSVGQIADALAVLLDRPETTLRAELISSVRSLVVDGYLTFP